MHITEENQKIFLKSKFHQCFDITLNQEINIVEDNIEQFVNFVLPLDMLPFIEQENNIGDFSRFLNDSFDNVIFTPYNDDSKIYDYEFYANRYFIRMKPFCKTIRMHIIPKKYQASKKILFFRDNEQKINSENFICTNEYERDSEKKTINLYYKENTEKDSFGFYKFDIKEHTKNMDKIQINFGYSYNDTNPNPDPIKNKHFTGILDYSNENGIRIPESEFTEYNSTLMDYNADRNADYTNKIAQNSVNNNGINWDNIRVCDGGFNVNHQINQVFHKTLKYFNDDLYTEEDGKSHVEDWIEQ